MNRFLKYINLVVALALVVAAGIVWWYGWRVLAKTSGTVEAPLGARAVAVRDDWGVPHIEAASIEDTLFVQGYVTAQDRLFQMELVRRQASGTLAEVVGQVALESDIEARRLRLRRIAEQHARALPEKDRRVLAAYARGVNHFIDTHLGKYPVEFSILGFDPAPWTMADSLLMALTMYRALTNTWRDELVKKSMLEVGEANKVQALFPVRTGLEPQPGSNAWVLPGSRTVTGKPLLANDPHLGFSLPGIWYQVQLKAPGLNVAGVSLPGLPGVTIGHNERIAWGMTNLHFDVQDLYEARVDAPRGVYLDEGRLAALGVEKELLRIRGGGRAEITVMSTRYGPIVAEEGGRHYSLRWTASEPGVFSYPLVDLNRAGNWNEFLKALEQFPGPAQNFVFADAGGNIGYHVAGRLPVRKTYDGDVPVAPREWAEKRWEGYIPFDELPSVYNSGRAIVTANQNPFPEKYGYRVSGAFATHHRAQRIREMLRGREKWSAAEMLEIQKDVFSGFHKELARQLAAAGRGMAASHPLLSQCVPMLESWNGRMEIGDPAAFLAAVAFQHVRKAVAERAAPGKSGSYDDAISYAVVERLLRERPKDWFGDWDQVLRQALLDAAEEAARIQGNDPAKWDYGRANAVLLKNPILGDLMWVGKYFRTGPVRMSGAATTVKQTTPRLGPSMRFVADAAAWDRSLMNVTTGQSGQPLSSHYRDQWADYYVGRSHSMVFSKADGDRLEFVPRP